MCKANLGELYVIALNSAQLYSDESYRFFSGIGNQSALYYIESQMIELALKKGKCRSLAGDNQTISRLRAYRCQYDQSE